MTDISNPQSQISAAEGRRASNTRVKICGITSLADAVCAAEAGADALGFVFAESSRRMQPAAVREILSQCNLLPPAVGVFVDTPCHEVRATLRTSGCAIAQLHGTESADYIDLLWPHAVIKALRVGPDFSPSALQPYARAHAILLDTYVAGKAGGTGQRFDPELAAGLSADWRLVVAGGLTPDNVADVVRLVRPYAVDVSGGVEYAPGKKDPQKLRDFIAAVREA